MYEGFGFSIWSSCKSALSSFKWEWSVLIWKIQTLSQNKLHSGLLGFVLFLLVLFCFCFITFQVLTPVWSPFICFHSNNCHVQLDTVFLILKNCFLKLPLYIPGVASLAKWFMRGFFPDISVVFTDKDLMLCSALFSENAVLLLTLHKGE